MLNTYISILIFLSFSLSFLSPLCFHVSLIIHVDVLAATAHRVFLTDSSALLNVQCGALELKNKGSMHSKPTTIGVSCLPPRSLRLYLSFPPPFPSFAVVMSHCSGKKTLIQWLDSSLPNLLSLHKNAHILPHSSRDPLICNLKDYCPQYLVE